MTTGPLPRRSASFTCLPPGAVKVKSGALSPTCSAFAGLASSRVTSTAAMATAEIPPPALLMRVSFRGDVWVRGTRPECTPNRKQTAAQALRFLGRLHVDDTDVEVQGLAGQRVVQIENNGAIPDLLDPHDPFGSPGGAGHQLRADVQR